MILTFIYPCPKSLKEGYVIEARIYEDTEREEAESILFNRTHERWAARGQIWLTNGPEYSPDRVLLKTWYHIIGVGHNVVMEVEGETE